MSVFPSSGAPPESEVQGMDVDTPLFYPAPIVRTEIGPGLSMGLPIEFKEREVKIQGVMSRRDRLMRSPDESDTPSAEEVTQLDMTGLPIQSFSELRYYKNLTKLVWRNLSNEDLALLLLSYANPNITYLDLSRDECDEGKLQTEYVRKKDIELMNDPLEPYPVTGELPKSFISRNLTYLNVSGMVRLTDRKRMFEMYTSKGLRSVDVGNKRLRYMVENHPHLTELIASCTGMTSVDQLENLSALTSLDVSNNYLTGQDFREIIYKFPAIKRLNISRNELGDGDVQLVLDPEFKFPFVELDVSNQKINYINPQILEILRDKVSGVEAKEVKEMKEIIDYSKEIFRAGTQQNLDDILNQHPKLQHLSIAPVDEIVEWQKFDNFSGIPKLKHLQSLKFNSMRLNHVLARDIFKSKTCIDIEVLNCDFGIRTRWIARAIQSNKVLQTLHIDTCIVRPNILLAIFQNRSITYLELKGIDIDDDDIRFDKDACLEEILKNDILLSLQFTHRTLVSDDANRRSVWGVQSVFGTEDEKLIQAHLAENRQKLQVMHMLPLIAATQLGGSLRHSILRSPALGMISGFMGQPTPELETTKQISQFVEPVRTHKKSTRSQTAPPLPLLFDPLLYEKAKSK